MIRVLIIESEKGFGSRLDEVKEFETLEEAKSFVKEYNAKNNEVVVPDWYMFAKLQENN